MVVNTNQQKTTINNESRLHKENKMAQNLVSEEQVKDALQINKFSEISKDKIMEFVSLIPNKDKEVAIAIINQFPAYADSANNMVAQLNDMCDNVIKNNNSSQKDAVEAYKVILQDLSELLKKEDISKEERDEITEKMILVADKISAKDTENKDFLNGIIKYGVPIVGGALLLGAAILGVNVKETKIPTIKKQSKTLSSNPFPITTNFTTNRQ